MTLTINLPPEEEAKLSNAAARQGLGASEYAHRLLMERLGLVDATPSDQAGGDRQPFYVRATAEEWKCEFEVWSQSHDRTTPLLSDEALRRESLYEDRGL
ncbi:MAG: hypothetical protein AABN33_02120 [Acidobacteriota bacterium]